MLASQSNICELHSSEAVAIEYKASVESPLLMLCCQCLIERTSNKNMFLMKDANQVAASIKQQCFSQWEEGINQKIQNLQRFSSMVAKLKDQLDTYLENISNTLQQWINQQMNLLASKGLENFSASISEEAINNEEEYKKFVQIEFENIQQCEILNQCMEYFSLIFIPQPIDFQIKINQKEVYEPQVILVIIQKTPKLDLLCQEHQMEIIMFDLSENQIRDKRILCIECDPRIFTSLTKVQSLWKNYLSNQASIMQKFFLARDEQINSLKKQMIALKKLYVEKINYLVQQLNLELAKVKQNIQQNLQQMNKDLNELSREQILDIAELLSKPLKMAQQLTDMDSNYKSKNEHINKTSFQTVDELEELQIQFLKVIDGFLDSQNQQHKTPTNGHKLCKLNVKDVTQFDSQDSRLKRSYNKLKQQDSNRKQVQPSQKLIDYQIIYTRKQTEWCNAMAFNKDGTIFAAGCKYDIKVWDFHGDKLTCQYIAKGHTGDVNCLLFSKKDNMFISGSDDKTIRIWVGENNEWKCTQKLNEHKDWVICIVMNQEENELISGGRDCSIKIWVRLDIQFTCRQTLVVHTDSVLCLSLNDSESLFVSCSSDKAIIVWKRGINNWEQHQILKQETYGNRICFVGDDQFFWQPISYDNVHLYQLKESMFEKIKHNIQQFDAYDDYLFFPSIYIKNKQILINVHYSFIYIIRKQDDQFTIEQIIEFEDYRNFGTLTLDGEYLATWEYKSSEFKIRKNVGTSRLSEFI